MTASSHVDRFVLDRLPRPENLPEFLFDLPPLHYPERLNAAVALIDGGDSASIAVVNESGSWTYGQMRDLSNRIARVLVRSGLVPGNRVLLRGPNGATLFAAWLGVLKAGGVAVTTMPILRTRELTTIIDRAEIGHAIVDSRYAADLDTAVAATGIRCVVLRYDGDLGSGELEALVGAEPGDFEAVATRADDPALIAFTSGTTGVPKACVHFHRDILAVGDTFAAQILRPRRGDRWACSAPIAFTFGLGMLLIFPWRTGGTAVTCEKATPADLLRTAVEYQATIIGTAPTAYRAMLSDPTIRELGGLRLCVSAGEHLPAATWTAWRDATGMQLVDGIGATEMMHVFVSAGGNEIVPGATGRAVPGYQVVVLDEADKPLTSGVGRLAVKGPTGCRYLDDARQSDYVKNGWNVTGDTYRLDVDGRFWFVARSDDMIVSSGYNIAAPEVEDALHAHAAVEDCAVIGVPCHMRGQRVKAFVVPAPGHDGCPALADELKEHVKRSIAPYKYPRDVEFVAELPKTATGKVKRFALR